jgi:hypothetical protein
MRTVAHRANTVVDPLFVPMSWEPELAPLRGAKVGEAAGCDQLSAKCRVSPRETINTSSGGGAHILRIEIAQK